MTAKIMTINSAYKNGRLIGGYNEIHDIKFLSSYDHLFATIESIVKNNLFYGCDDAVLTDIWITVPTKKDMVAVTDHFKGKCGKIPISVECDYK